MTAALITHPACALHEHGSPYHVEMPERLDAIQTCFDEAGMDAMTTPYLSPQATREQLVRAHHPDYVETVFLLSPATGYVDLDSDTRMNCYSLTAALHAAGAAVMAVDTVMAATHRRAFCLVRPPGHHAGHYQAAGFCIFNNVAVGAAHALAVYGLERVAIVDFDVHHGDGTENIFQQEPRVLFCSSFQHPYYPGTGADTNSPGKLNQPMPKGTDAQTWREAVSTHWLPALREFRPQLVMISAGFDSHAEDEMGNFQLQDEDYAWITAELCKIAADFAEGRVVSCLEGGYTLLPLGRAATAHIRVLANYPEN